MSALRVFVFGGRISFRALFNWRHPTVYVPTMLGKPLFQLVFFTILGRYAVVADDTHFVVGAAIQASAMSGIYGMVMLLVNEREFSTMGAVLGSPANRFALFGGRTWPVIAHAIVITTFSLSAGFVLLGFRMPVEAVPAVAATVVLTATTGTMLGLVVGAIGLRRGDLWVGSNLTYYALLLLCGGIVPVAAMPDWMGRVAHFVPLTSGIEAARNLANGATLAHVAPMLVREGAVGLGYALVGSGLVWLFQLESRHRASF